MIVNRASTDINQIELMGYLNAYYIVNALLVLVYPVHKLLNLNTFFLFKLDGFGFTYQSSIIYTMLTILSLNYIRSYSMPQFVSEALLLLKVTVFCFYTFVGVKYALWYAGVCSLSWFFVAYPRFKGVSKLVEIKSQDQFQKTVESTCGKQVKPNHQKKNKKKQQTKLDYSGKNMWVVEFYVNWALTCLHSKQIWAEFSNKYTTDKLKFGSVNLERMPEMAEEFSINTSGFSRQLPTVIVFQDGKEVSRFPPIDSKTKRIAKVLKYESKGLAKYFDLEQRYLESRVAN